MKGDDKLKERMTIHEFIQYTKENPLKFISYCEIILDNLGYVYLAIPSHQEKLIELYCEKYHMTRLSKIISQYDTNFKGFSFVY